MPSEPRVVQVTNVAPATTRDQIKTLFGFIGRIDDLVIYPSVESTSTTSKVCYVKFEDADDVAVALHLTNTVFIDRALTVVTVPEGRIPDEKTAMSSSYAKNLASSDAPKGDEVERTVYVANLDAAVAPETLMQFFGLHAGEVKYARMAGDESLPVRGAFIEFSEKSGAASALSITGQLLGSRPVTVVPSNSAIVKSASGLEGATSREIEEALRKVNEAQPLISAVVDSDGSRQKRSRSKSRSRHRRSRSRSRSSRRRRSRSKSPRSRRRSTSKSPKPIRSSSKSKDHRRRRSRSRSPKSSRSRRSRSWSRNRKSRGDGDKEARVHGNGKKLQESSRQRSRSSRSKSPGSRDSRKDKHRDTVGYDREPERDKRDKKSGEKRSQGDRKTSKHHRREVQDRKGKKAAKHRNEYSEDEVDDEEEGKRSAEEESDNEQDVEEPASESGQSDAEREASEEDSPEGAQANLSRMDMDVDSD